MLTYRDWRFHKLVKQGGDKVEVFMSLRRLMVWWRDDPEKLAVAVTAYEALGYAMAAFDIMCGDGLDGVHAEHWTDDQAYAAIEVALKHKPRRVLRARAYGLVMALVELAPAAERDLLHGIQVDAAVIECRQLPIEERIAKLREMDRV